MILRKGSLALCSRSYLGVVLSNTVQQVEYPDGTRGEAWTGIHLGSELLGKVWSSRTPRVVGHVDDLRAILTEFNLIQSESGELDGLF